MQSSNVTLIEAARFELALAEYGGASRATVSAAAAELQAAERAAETPQQTIDRLHFDARMLDEQSDLLIKEAAEYAGKAELRRQQGCADLAENFQRMADAREELAVKAMTEAFGLKLDACRIMVEIDQATDLTGFAKRRGAA